MFKSEIDFVAIHNKNGKGLLQSDMVLLRESIKLVAIHNKNGKGLLQTAISLNG